MANFVIKIFRETKNDQVAFSPEFSCCKSCQQNHRGLVDTCPSCGSDQMDHITRITGYFTRVSSWNKGKLGELRDRWRNEGFFSARPRSRPR